MERRSLHRSRLHYKFDNSLQQIENDLRDLLDKLQERGFRTVVVLEELDKLDETADDQLDEVIRYFKNLFTQAPALFFFVTDKSYFDTIAGKILEARRSRKYAVEHTFFFERIFVGRPTTADCLAYIKGILRTPSDIDIVGQIYQSPRFATESFGSPTPQNTPLSLFTRVVLFRAANHLFDLKNELRRYVRQDGTDTVLAFDNELFPPEEQALAKFQDVIADKYKAFEIKGGRQYANEVMRDCLYAVFNQLGSSAPQSIRALLPLTTPATSGSGKKKEPLDSLDISDVQRIEQAVSSLLNDLQRGFAIKDRTTDNYTWAPNASTAFSPVKKPEVHEDALAARLRRTVSLCKTMISRLGATHPAEAAALQAFADAKNTRAEFVAAASGPIIQLDAAQAEEEAVDREFGKALEPIYDAHRARASALFGVRFAATPIEKYENGAALWVMQTADGDPREPRSGHVGSVIVAQGSHERIADDIFKFGRGEEGIDKLGILHVLPPGSTAEECRQAQKQDVEGVLRAQMQTDRASVQRAATSDNASGSNVTPPTIEPEHAPLRVKALALEEETGEWGSALGRELVSLSFWAVKSREPNPVPPVSNVVLQTALDKYLKQERRPDAVLIIDGVTEPDFVYPRLHGALRDSEAEVAIVEVAQGPGLLEIDPVQQAQITLQFRTRAAVEAGAPMPVYEQAVRSLLRDASTVIVVHGTGPLTAISADSFGHDSLIVYVGSRGTVGSALQVAEDADLQVQPQGQFTTPSGTVGTYSTQNLKLYWGVFPRIEAPKQAPASAPNVASAAAGNGAAPANPVQPSPSTPETVAR